MHYYQFNIGDYASHTAHLDPLEDIAYRRMMDWCYLHELPLPESTEDIARLIRMRTHSDCIANVLREFFYLDADGYKHARIEIEVTKFHGKSAKAKASADARWLKEKKKRTDANALRPECEGNAKHKPQTTKQDNSPKNKFSDDDMKCAEYIAKGVAEVSPSLKPNLNKWADVIRLIRERDGHNHKEICDMFKWAHADEFWKANILSPDKLRKQWPTLEAKRNHGGGPQNKPEWAKIPMDDEEMVKWAAKWKYPKAGAHDNYNQYRGKLRALVQARLDKGEG